LNTVLEGLRRIVAAARRRERGTGPTTRRRTPPTRAVERGVRIEYRPMLDGDPDPGEVVWTWVPFDDDPTLGKDRPVVIIGRHGEELVGIALTSKDKGRGDHVEIGAGPWDDRGRPSYAKVDRLLDIDAAAVRREGAILPRERFDRVVAAVEQAHDVVR
jgi:hypothetical protein